MRTKYTKQIHRRLEEAQALCAGTDVHAEILLRLLQTVQEHGFDDAGIVMDEFRERFRDIVERTTAAFDILTEIVEGERIGSIHPSPTTLKI